MERILAIEVYEASTYKVDSTAQIKPDSLDDGGLFPQWITSYEETLTMDELDSLVIDIAPGSPWHVENVLAVNDRVVIHIDTVGDGAADTYRCYRIRNLLVMTGEEGALKLQCWSIDGDLGKYIWGWRPGPDPDIRRNFDFIGFTLNQILGEVFSGVGLPAQIVVGTVASSITDLELNPEVNGNTYTEILGILRDEMLDLHGKTLEYVHSYDHTTGEIIFDFHEEIGGNTADTPRVISAPGIHEDSMFHTQPANRITAAVQNVQDDYVSRLVATSGGADDEEITTAQIEWQCIDCKTDSNILTITPEEGLIGFVDQFKDYVLIQNDHEWDIISNTLTEMRLLGGGQTFDAQRTFKMAERVDGELVWLDYIRRPDAESTLGIVYRKQDFKVTPYPNLFEEHGGSGDFSVWPGGEFALPTNISIIQHQGAGAVTVVTQNKERKYITQGTRSMRVQAGKNSGVRAEVVLKPTKDHPYVSVDCVMQVVSGSVRMFIENTKDQRFPPTNEKQHDGKSSVTFSLRLEGAELEGGTAFVWLQAKEDGTDFYVDSLSVTQSHTAWPYSPLMGPKALWKTATQWMEKDGGEKPLTSNVQFVDLTYLDDTAAPIMVGSHVRMIDLVNNGTPFFKLDGRVQSINSGPGMPAQGVFKRTATIGRQRRSLIQSLEEGSRPTRKQRPVAPLSPAPRPELPEATAWYNVDLVGGDGKYVINGRWNSGGDARLMSIQVSLTVGSSVVNKVSNERVGGFAFDDNEIDPGGAFRIKFVIYSEVDQGGDKHTLFDVSSNAPNPPVGLDVANFKRTFDQDITAAEIVAKLLNQVLTLSGVNINDAGGNKRMEIDDNEVVLFDNAGNRLVEIDNNFNNGRVRIYDTNKLGQRIVATSVESGVMTFSSSTRREYMSIKPFEIEMYQPTSDRSRGIQRVDLSAHTGMRLFDDAGKERVSLGRDGALTLNRVDASGNVIERVKLGSEEGNIVLTRTDGKKWLEINGKDRFFTVFDETGTAMLTINEGGIALHDGTSALPTVSLAGSTGSITAENLNILGDSLGLDGNVRLSDSDGTERVNLNSLHGIKLFDKSGLLRNWLIDNGNLQLYDKDGRPLVNVNGSTGSLILNRANPDTQDNEGNVIHNYGFGIILNARSSSISLINETGITMTLNGDEGDVKAKSITIGNVKRATWPNNWTEAQIRAFAKDEIKKAAE